MARTPRYTAEQVIQALDRTRGMVTLAAEQLGCDYHTVENYAKRYPAVAEAIHRQRERILDITELKLHQAINDGESWAIQFMLRTVGKHRGYVERHEVTGKDGESLTIHLTWDGYDSTRADAQEAVDSPAPPPPRAALRAAK